MSLNRLGFLFGILIGTLVIILLANPVQAGCLIGCWSRDCAQEYGLSAVDEPYRVTHAEWTDDNQKTWVGEGVDCSGLVHKTWAMQNAQGSKALFWWKTEEVIPADVGSYSAAGFYSNCASTYACEWVCDGGNCPMTNTVFMDAFATLNDPANPNDNHVGLVYEELSNSEDRILEAVDQVGDKDVRIIIHNWRTLPIYRGIKRNDWSYSCSSCPDCKTVYLPHVNRDPGDQEKSFGDPDPYPSPKLVITTPYPYP